MLRTKLPVATTLAVVATLGLTAGCGSDGGGGSAEGDSKGGAAVGRALAKLPMKPSEKPTPEPTDEPTDEPTGAPTGNPLVSEDVKMGNCGWDSSNMPYAEVKISNSSSTKQDYTIFVGFVDKDDEVVTTGMSSDASVAGNGSKTVTVKGLEADAAKKAKTCKITLATKTDALD
ncbi:PT domain-containing protein [Streptomyces sp. NPDC018031]|uniref:PT domain-containing protein n=1 Tax=Streptomyces sp. NPDC018031 TaxID=3365033 RepID=UPI0037AEA82E